MLELLKRYKVTILTIVILAGAAFFLARVYTPENASEILSNISTPSEEGTLAGEQILLLLSELEAIMIDTAFFESEAYVDLRDQSSPVTPEPVGRRNPFNDIGFGVDIQGQTASPLGNENDIVDIFNAEPEPVVEIVNEEIPDVFEVEPFEDDLGDLDSDLEALDSELEI